MKINGLPTLVFPSENERGNMSKQDITKLDMQTLQFATHIAWQFESLCENTKDGRTKACAFRQVKDVLEHYINKLES